MYLEKKSYYNTAKKLETYFKEKKACKICGVEIIKNKKYSLMQWSQSKFCSRKCNAENQKIKDGLTRGERYARKAGRVKKGTPEWLERIKVTTKNAMQRPDVKEKIRKPKGPQSLERRKKQSDLLAGKMPKNMQFGGDRSGCFSNVQRGWYLCSKGELYFRSKWEANYALYLDFLVEKKEIQDWEFEPETFIFHQIQMGTRSYTPDFKVFTTNTEVEYHEVKGYMDNKSKTKLKRMAKYYPEVKILLIDNTVYNNIKKTVGKMLNFY